MATISYREFEEFLEKLPEGTTRTSHVHIRNVKRLHHEGSHDGFTFSCDEPPDRAGDGAGAGPLGFFLGGWGMCQMNQYVRVADVFGIKLDGLEMDTHGTYDRKRGGAFNDLLCEVYIKSSASVDQIKKLVKTAEYNCVAGKTLEKGTPITSKIYLNGEHVHTTKRGPTYTPPTK